MTGDKKKMSLYALLAALFTGGGGYLGADFATEALLTMGDKRWVTVASQNLQTQWGLEDEMRHIQRRIDNDTATLEDRERMAVLQDRLRRILAFEN